MFSLNHFYKILQYGVNFYLKFNDPNAENEIMNDLANVLNNKVTYQKKIFSNCVFVLSMDRKFYTPFANIQNSLIPLTEEDVSVNTYFDTLVNKYIIPF